VEFVLLAICRSWEAQWGVFLSMAARRAKRIMAAVEVVVVVGCFAASTAHLHPDFDQNIPNPL
jgi:hypothetical protein